MNSLTLNNRYITGLFIYTYNILNKILYIIYKS